MEKIIKSTYGGKNTKMCNLLVNRLVPNNYVRGIGPFVLLDHFYPLAQKPVTAPKAKGSCAHPHRGISKLTYLMSGESEHFDSRGNHGITGSGGIQWTKTGKGICIDEGMTYSFQHQGGLLHQLQFWINLPSKNKHDEPEYLNLKPGEITELILPDDAGTLRILIGSYGTDTSPVRSSSHQFLYHIRLNPKSVFSLPTKKNIEYAAFVPTNEAKINNRIFGKSELIVFDNDECDVVLGNDDITELDIIIFGGEPYREAIVAEGPFVMNTRSEIIEAYNDFHSGKYGKIDYLVEEQNL